MKPASKRKAAGSPTKAQARSKRRHSRDLCPLCPGNTAPHSRSQNKPASTNSSKSQDEESAVYDTWLQCNACRAWYHARCVGLAAAECQRIKRYHCQTCQPTAGPTVYYAQRTLRRSGRAHTVINYADLNEGVAGDVYKYTKLLQARTFAPSPFPVFETGQFLTATWLETHGLDEPILVRKPQGLGLVMPSPDLSVDEIAQLIGPETPVDVIDVANQGELTGWNLGQWAKYVNQRIRDRILNVISLEVSDTPLTRLIQRPRVVREIDWISTVWPTELKDQGEYPKVQHYCLMSVRDSYTDFHVDFGGTSVFYHLLSGEKIFYFIPPTSANHRKFEKWMKSPDQASVFFGDLVKTCYRLVIRPGNTLLIPSGWIHAVHTTQDSVVIGGNFLCGINIGMQLDMYYMEERVAIPQRQRFPLFERMQWFAAQHYLKRLNGPTSLPPRLSKGLKRLLEFLNTMLARAKRDPSSLATVEQRRLAKLAIPDNLNDPAKLVADLEKALAER